MLAAKVWGFTKYHYPTPLDAPRDWDAELLRLLPDLLASTDLSTTQNTLAAWLDSLGDPPACDPCAPKPTANVALGADLGWLDDGTLLGEHLSAKLKHIYARRTQGPTPFARVAGAGNANLLQEAPYADLAFPDHRYQILAVFRLWNAVEYWFPYRDHIEESWDAALREFLPRVALAASREQYARELMAMIARLDDSHANLWSAIDLRPPAGKCTVPVKLRWTQGAPTVVARLGDSADTPLAAGDVLVAIDGQPVETLVNLWSPYYGASNEASRRRDLSWSLLRGACGPAQVTVRRDTANIDLQVTRVELAADTASVIYKNDRPGETFQVLPGPVAYLKASGWKTADVPSYLERAEAAGGLVIDLRGYPAEFAVYELASRLIERETPFAGFTEPDFSNPGTFAWSEPAMLPAKTPTFSAPVVVLVDETTQSQAEFTAMALRAAPNTVIVGSQTAGADGNISQLVLPGGFVTAFSGLGVFYPDGRPTQRIGIQPDVVVEPTREGVIAGKDEVLEAARELLLQRVRASVQPGL